MKNDFVETLFGGILITPIHRGKSCSGVNGHPCYERRKTRVRWIGKDAEMEMHLLLNSSTLLEHLVKAGGYLI